MSCSILWWECILWKEGFGQDLNSLSFSWFSLSVWISSLQLLTAAVCVFVPCCALRAGFSVLTLCNEAFVTVGFLTAQSIDTCSTTDQLIIIISYYPQPIHMTDCTYACYYIFTDKCICSVYSPLLEVLFEPCSIIDNALIGRKSWFSGLQKQISVNQTQQGNYNTISSLSINMLTTLWLFGS